MEIRDAVAIAAQMAEGLAAAHAKGIVHRDIKPDNVMLVDGSRVVAKIMDFGLAQLVGTSKMTREGTALGTMYYMSPEQAEGGQVDYRSDIWSLGATLYEMLAGERPFRGDFDQAVPYSILNEQPEPLTSIRAEVPRELSAVVGKCLAKDPGDRYQDTAEFEADLASFRDGATSQSAANEVTTNRRPLNWLFGAAAAVALAAAGWFWDAGPATPSEADPNPSVAIMPFINASGDPEFEYFADGMTDELINALGKVEGLRVVGRSSVFQFKGKAYNAAEVGERLRVGALLEGTVRTAGERLRITTQLVNASDGFELWADRYESEMKDVFDIQDEISMAMVGALSQELLGSLEGPIVRASTANPEAYRLYLQANRSYELTEASLRRKISLLSDAVAIDPEFAHAYAALAVNFNYLSGLGFEEPGSLSVPIREAALRALELDDTIAESHAALGESLDFVAWDARGAEQAVRRAIELHGANTQAHRYLGMLLIYQGRTEEAVSHLRTALDIDPLSSGRLSLCYSLTIAGRFDEAIEQADRTLEIDQRLHIAHLHKATSYLGLKRPEEAIREMELAFEPGPNPALLGVLGMAQADAGKTNEARTTIDRLLALRQEGYAPALPLAEIYARLGELDEAFRWLNVAVDQHEPLVRALKYFDVYYAPLHGDPRFDEILQRIGYWD